MSRRSMASCLPPTRRITALALTVLLLVQTTGCYSYTPAFQAPEPGSSVRITLKEAMTVTGLATAVSPEQTYTNVTEVRGMVQATTRDTITMQLSSIRTTSGSFVPDPGTIAKIPVNRIGSIERRFMDPGRAVGNTFLAMLAVVLGGVLLLSGIGAN